MLKRSHEIVRLPSCYSLLITPGYFYTRSFFYPLTLEKSHKFDILILSHILEHLDNPQIFINMFKDYFKFIYIEVPDFEKNYLNLYRKDLNLNLIYSDADHISEFDRDELKSLLNSSHLKILKEDYRFGVQKFWCTPIK